MYRINFLLSLFPWAWNTAWRSDALDNWAGLSAKEYRSSKRKIECWIARWEHYEFYWMFINGHQESFCIEHLHVSHILLMRWEDPLCLKLWDGISLCSIILLLKHNFIIYEKLDLKLLVSVNRKINGELMEIVLNL